MKVSLRWMLLFGMLFVAGCASVEPVLENYIDIARSKGISSEYTNELAKWTRKSILYSEFETRAYIISTYKSREFRQAYDREYARLYALTPSEQARKASIQGDPASESTEFVFYAYNPDMNALDFSKANSIWKVFLLDEKGGRIDPVEIRQITKITPLIEQFYPYVNQYHGKFYSIKFPPGAGASQKLQLVFTGVLGRIGVVWP